MVGEQSPGHPPLTAKKMADCIKAEWVTYHLFDNAGSPVYKDSARESYQVVKQFVEKFCH